MKLILASSSPRRADILRDAGISFTVLSSAVDETPYANETPQQLVQRLADAKADLVAARAVGSSLIVAADTVVVMTQAGKVAMVAALVVVGVAMGIDGSVPHPAMESVLASLERGASVT